MLDVALQIPLGALGFRGFGQGNDACAARVQVFAEARDGAALARRIPPLEYDHHARSGPAHPGQQFDQLDLQLVHMRAVVPAAHYLAVRIARIDHTLARRRVDRVTHVGGRLLPVIAGDRASEGQFHDVVFLRGLSRGHYASPQAAWQLAALPVALAIMP